jgi:CHAD domain-containing protein
VAVTELLERELKLAAPDGFELPELPGEPLEPRVFTSSYYDTEDRRLLRAGCTLRRRLENGGNTWQLKIPRGEHRVELETPGGPADPPAELTDLLVALLRGRRLVKVATLRTRRGGVRVHDDEAHDIADVVVDSVAVLEGRRVTASFAEIEVELRNGDSSALERIEGVLRRAGAGPHDGRPKVQRTIRLDEITTPPASAPLAEHIRARIGSQVAAMLTHDPGVRLGTDPEDLHDLRVAVRRLRALLRGARNVVEDGDVERARAELDWLGGALGPARDLDVLLERIRIEEATLDAEDRAALEPLRAGLVSAREGAQTELVETLRSERYLALLDELERLASALPVAPDVTTSAGALAAGEFRRLRKAARRLLDEESAETVHAVRIKAKRARYAAELTESSGGRRVRRFVARAKRLQDVIGEHQDAVVAEERLRQLARGRGGRSALVAGRLVERQRHRRETSLAAFPRAWRKLERASRRAWA